MRLGYATRTPVHPDWLPLSSTGLVAWVNKMPNTRLPTAEELNNLLRYEPKTGKLFWRKRDASMFTDGQQTASHNCNAWNGKCAGKEAFISIDGKGYRAGKIHDRQYRAHRIIWAMRTGAWPRDQIDHVNRDRTDNRITNLREASISQNAHNAGLRRDNSSGFKGVSRHSASSKWRAEIRINNKRRSLGYYDTPEAAHAAYCEASRKLHGEFSNEE